MTKTTTHFSRRRLNRIALLLVSLLLSTPAIAYDLIDLGANVEPLAVNDDRIVVGASNTDQAPTTAFRWSETAGLEVIDGTAAYAVNDSGQIAGNTIDGAFVLDGNFRDWSDYAAFGNNAFGIVAGYKVGDNPWRPTSLPFNPARFDGNHWQVWDIAQLYPRGTRQGVYADRFILNAINDSDLAVGYKYRYGLAGSSAILIDTNANIDSASDVVWLPIPNGGRATAINNANRVVGYSGANASAGEFTFAFLYDYDAGTLLDLGTLPSDGPGSEPGISSYAYDINDADQVVGRSWLVTALTTVVDPTKYHAFLWQDGEMADLNDLPSVPQGWLLTRATAINESGDIVGVGLVDDVEHGFLLTSGDIGEPPPSENQPPVAVALADSYSGKAPLLVAFDGTNSYDPDGTIASYAWDFNDGSPDSYSSEPSPTHEFASKGTYLVNLTVTDDLGTTASDSITIVVKKGRPR